MEYPDIDLNAASQQVLQSAFDKKALTICKESASIRDRARLNTHGSFSAGAWLRAIPNPKLGLAMSRHKFIPAIKMWLGLQLLPTSPQPLHRTCGQIIDRFGDHHLGCAQSPIRIKCHDTLHGVIWHALLMDKKGAIQEQHCGESNNKRPGVVYHPDFAFGKPAYFDVSVPCSLQSQFLSMAAVQAGAAGQAGEIEKDSRHEEDVSAGGIFYPLVVETLGLWTPSSLQVLCMIATKASSIGGIPRGLTFRNLLEQLSVRLWTFNSRMLHNRLESEGLDLQEWDLPTYV